MELLDYFHHNGPNGTHLCLVLPVMLSDGKEMTVRGQLRDAAYIKKLSAEIILGLDFLHQSNVIHCGKLDILAFLPVPRTSWPSDSSQIYNQQIFCSLWLLRLTLISCSEIQNSVLCSGLKE